jgi:uncharacterized membrane protein YuzA (DUF378 family)
MAKMSKLDYLAITLLIVGGINWATNFWGLNLVELISFGSKIISGLIYNLVGLSAIYSIVRLIYVGLLKN